MKVHDLQLFVKENEIDAEFIEHPGRDGLTSEGAASATGIPLAQVIKVLCITDKKEKCFVILQGSKKVDMRKIPGIKKGRLATGEELLGWFGFEPGCVPPICLPEEIPKYIDVGIKNLPFVVGSAGSRFVGIRIKPERIISQKNVMLADISL